MKIIVALLASMFLIVGCASNKVDPNYQAYLKAQEAQVSVHKQEIQILRIKAKEGQQITLGGVEEFTVSMPAPAAAPVQQAVQQPSQWAGVLSQGLGVAGTVLGIKYVGQAAVNLSNSVGTAANHGYQFVQAPQANQTLSGTGVLGSGTYQITTTTTDTSTLSGTGVLGTGTYTTAANPVTTTNTTNTTPVGP